MLDLTSYKTIQVDLAAMGSLSRRLRDDGDKLKTLMNSLVEDVRKVGYEWEDDNYCHFLLYFLDRADWVLHYDEFVQDQANWLDKAIPEYAALPDDILSRTGTFLGRVGL
jgi:hypothetical protein